MMPDRLFLLIEDYIPEILSIDNYEDRIKKCIEIINLKVSTDNEIRIILRQDCNDLCELLEYTLSDEKLRELTKEENIPVYEGVCDIRKLCSRCLFRIPELRTIPSEYVFDVSDTRKIKILGISIGDTVSDVDKSLARYGITDQLRDNSHIDINHDVVFGNRNSFKMHINHDGVCVTDIFLSKNNALYDVEDHKRDVGGFWHVLADVDNILKKCNYSLDKCTTETINQTYTTFYDIIKVTHNRHETNITVSSK